MADDAERIVEGAMQVGYLDEDCTLGYRDGIVSLLRTVTEPLRHDSFAFGNADIAGRLRDQVIAMRVREKYARIPPPHVLFLHRKLGGLYLLLSSLRARLPVRDRVESLLSNAATAN